MFREIGFLIVYFIYGCQARCFDKYNEVYYETGAKFRRDKPMGDTTLLGTYDCTCKAGGYLHCYAFNIPCWDVVENTFIPKGEKFVANLGGKRMECTCVGGRGAFRNCYTYESDGCFDIHANRKVSDGEYYTTHRFGAEVSCICESGKPARASCSRVTTEADGCFDEYANKKVPNGKFYTAQKFGAKVSCLCERGQASCSRITTGCRDHESNRLVQTGERYLVESYSRIFECSCSSSGRPISGTCQIQTRRFEYDPCKSADCHPMARCQARGSSYICDCKSGFRGSGRYCADINECSSRNRCHENANCNNTEGSYTCTCEPGYIGDGYQCTRHDPCDEGIVFCSMNAECIPDQNTYQCVCTRGFTGDGFTCQDTDECETGASDCDVNALCQNVHGRYSCTCKKGYEGDGHECKKMCLDDVDGQYVSNHNVFLKIKNGRRLTCTCQNGNAIEGSCHGTGGEPEEPTTTSPEQNTTMSTTTATPRITASKELQCYDRNNRIYYSLGQSYTWNRGRRSYLCVCTKRRNAAISRCKPVRYTS
ncbi:uncharacterized protein LOC120336684 isoform X1 [Styela clava]